MRILLNIVKRDNFVFFDKETGIHLNRVTPIGEVSKLTSSLKRAIVSGNVIDVDDSFNIEISENIKALNDKILNVLNIKKIVKDVVENIVEDAIEEKVEVAEEVIEEVIEDNNDKVTNSNKKKNKKKEVK